MNNWRNEWRSLLAKRVEEELRDLDKASYFLNPSTISSYNTVVAVPTARKEATFNINENGNLIPICDQEQCSTDCIATNKRKKHILDKLLKK